MSVQKVNVLVPPLRAVPPGAAWAAAAIGWLFDQDWLAAARKRLAVERSMRREAGERMALVAMARRYESSQPEFAKDLFAAARVDRSV